MPPGLALGLNAVMLCDTPSARMNCSRSSMLVRPLAVVERKEPSAKQVMCKGVFWTGKDDRRMPYQQATVDDREFRKTFNCRYVGKERQREKKENKKETKQ